MPGFPKPRFEYEYDLSREKSNFNDFFSERDIPRKGNNEIDLATWNVANLGLQRRRDQDLELIAHILSHFDMIAVQEVNVNLAHFKQIMRILKSQGFDMVITDKAGNDERLAVVYKTHLFCRGQLFGELDYNPAGKIVDNQYVIPPRVQSFTFRGRRLQMKFSNFNRNPFLTTWKKKDADTSFMLANVHIYFGEDVTNNDVIDHSPKFMNRIAEVFFLADWARKQQKLRDTSKLYEPNIILIGDMNIPKMRSDNVVYRALMRRGMMPSKWSTEAGTTIQEFKSYDQIVFTGEGLRIRQINNQDAVVVDFDNFIFRDLWRDRTLTQFKAWTKFAVSDHRPLFVRLVV